MAEYIELIDKYRIIYHDSPYSDYAPPSYQWVDNTGEIIRCRDCLENGLCCVQDVLYDNDLDKAADFYCAYGRRAGKDGN